MNQELSEEVLVLGAGFSKAIDDDMPLANELITKEHGMNINMPLKHGQKVSEFGDIEKLLTAQYLRQPWDSDKDFYDGRSAFEEISNFIRSKFIELELKRKPSNQWGTAKEFFKQLVIKGYRERKRYTFITFNYDMIVEGILKEVLEELQGNELVCNLEEWKSDLDLTTVTQRVYPAGIPSLWENGSPPPLKNTSKFPICLLKLHGSVNIGYNPEQPLNFHDITSIDSYVDMIKPLITPPVLDKSDFMKNIFIRESWKAAFQAIKHAKSLYLLGYSIPPTDFHARELLSWTGKETSEESTVHLINLESGGQLKNRCEEIFKTSNLNTDHYGSNSPVKEFLTQYTEAMKL